ncbi:MAG TPA: hypothetical protein VFJ78_05335 [Gaiellaceae bacterium]|nr:hypothetical protein [Gaiellaceae bacterium]
MHRSLCCVALLAVCAPLAAQASPDAARREKRPLESCGNVGVEAVLVADANGQSGGAHERAASEVSYWFRPSPSPNVRTTSYVVVLSPAGTGVRQLQPAGDSAYDRVARQAVEAAAHEHAFDALPRDSTGKANAVVYFGSDASGRPTKFVSRRVCDATPMPNNPTPMYPLELAPPPTTANVHKADSKQVMWGEVVARFLVDSAGVVDPASFQVVRASDPLFVREVRRVLPLLRYFPAEIGGRPTPELIEERFEFRVR